MRTVTILGVDSIPASNILTPIELFKLAESVQQNSADYDPGNAFSVLLASNSGEPINCSHCVSIDTDKSLSEIEFSDYVYVPSLGEQPEYRVNENPAIIDWLKTQYSIGATIAGFDTAMFLIATCDLFPHQKIALQPKYKKRFLALHAGVSISSNQHHFEDDRLLTASEPTKELSLIFELIERLTDVETRAVCYEKIFPQQYLGKAHRVAIDHSKKSHGDSIITAAQQWLETHYRSQINIEQLAKDLKISSRTLNRRFKKATGENPLEYTQRLRVIQAAKELLNSSETISTIAHSVGYDNTDFFRAIFKRYYGTPPKQYRIEKRKKFETPIRRNIAS